MTAKQRRTEARSTVTTRVVTAPPARGCPARGRPPPARPARPAPPRRPASPTATRSRRYVKPSLLLDKALPYDPANPALTTDPVFQLRTSLLDSERYLLGAQYLDRWYSRRGQRFTDVLARFSPERAGVRRAPAGDGGAHRGGRGPDGAHNDASVGRTKDDAIRYADWLVRSIACEHVAVTPGGWGAGLQTAHWAKLAGEAAWLIWDRLTPQTREYVAQMIVYEADHAAHRARWSYWADAAGTVRRPGRHPGRGGLLERRPARARGVDDADPPAGRRTGGARRSTSRWRPTPGRPTSARRAVDQRGRAGRPARRGQHLRRRHGGEPPASCTPTT